MATIHVAGGVGVADTAMGSYDAAGNVDRGHQRIVATGGLMGYADGRKRAGLSTGS